MAIFIETLAVGKGEQRANLTIVSSEGDVKSPNHPSSYSDNSHFRLHIRAASNASAASAVQRVIVRFKQIDLEYQQDCLYDYVALQGRENGPVTKLCGHHTTNLDG